MYGDTNTATMVSQQPTVYHHAYKNSAGQYTPMASGANTPNNLSPTSPRSGFSGYPQHAPQIRRPKNPIYVPAALRRTEKPQRQSPPKVDSAVDTPNSSWGSGPASGPQYGAHTQSNSLSLITGEDLNSIYGDTPLSPVAGPITRNHWQVCSDFLFVVVLEPFFLFRRRVPFPRCRVRPAATVAPRMRRLLASL